MKLDLCICGHPIDEHVEESSECRHDAEKERGCLCVMFERDEEEE